MALLFVDGFDFWTTRPGCWTSSASSEAPGTTVSGGKLTISGLAFATAANYVRWVFPASIQTVIINLRMAFTEKTVFQPEPVLVLFDSDTSQCSLSVNSAGQLIAYRSDWGGVVAQTQIGLPSTFGFVQDSTTFYDVEVKFVVANSGSCIVRVNGDEVLNVSGDFASTVNEYCNNILIGKRANIIVGSTATVIHEHVVIMDTTGTAMNDFIGPIKVNPHFLTADGFYIDFTANVGARWDAVNDLDPDGSATYITANVVGNKYTAVASDLPAGITNVYALAVWAKSQRSDDVTRAYKALLRYASADQLGSDDKYIGPNYAYQISTFNVSPFSGVAWTTTEVDGLEVGVQITV